jgi:hypothetical protein
MLRYYWDVAWIYWHYWDIAETLLSIYLISFWDFDSYWIFVQICHLQLQPATCCQAISIIYQWSKIEQAWNRQKKCAALPFNMHKDQPKLHTYSLIENLGRYVGTFNAMWCFKRKRTRCRALQYYFENKQRFS